MKRGPDSRAKSGPQSGTRRGGATPATLHLEPVLLPAVRAEADTPSVREIGAGPLLAQQALVAQRVERITVAAAGAHRLVDDAQDVSPRFAPNADSHTAICRSAHPDSAQRSGYVRMALWG